MVRYGEALGQRWRRYAFYTGLATAAGVTVVSLGAFSGFAAGFVGGQLPTAVQTAQRLFSRVVVRLPDGEVVKVKPHKVDLLNPAGETRFGLRVKHGGGETLLFGEEARMAARKVLPVVNRQGARQGMVRSAITQIESVGGVKGFLEETWGKARPWPGATIRWVMSGDMRGGNLARLPVPTRLGLEIALQEEQERRALGGELAALEAAWRQAEAIAEIFDELLVPRKVEETLAAMRVEEEGRRKGLGEVGPEAF
jgi:hypothetical protein